MCEIISYMSTYSDSMYTLCAILTDYKLNIIHKIKTHI